VGGARLLLAGTSGDEVVRENVGGGGLGAFLTALVPPNPIAAAAEGAILGVVVFAIIFGFATTRLPDRLRQPLTVFFEAVAETMIVIVHWVLRAAPIGVFALSLGVGLHTGLGAAGVLGHYIALVCLSLIGLILLTYVVAVAFGRLSLGRFAAAVAPAQVVAISTQSSLACLPVMVERAIDRLGVSPATAGDGRQWYTEFFGNCSALYGARGCQIAHLATHDYSCDATKTLAYLKELHDLFSLPVWLTEMSCGDGADAKPMADHLAYMRAVFPMLDSAYFVYRYAWMSARSANRGLVDSNGTTLTPVGELFVSL
jgi:hypothetical protein